MMKIVVLLFVIASCARADENSTDATNRQKRAMLFFDDEGHLMKSFVSPYLQQLAHYAASRPEHENFLKYFFNFLRPLIVNTATAAFMIPVSENVVQQINKDPVYQNKLTISKRGPAYNQLCVGRRTQIPSPSDCNSFLSCWDGWAYELECPEGLMFSSEGYCDYSDMVQCKDRAIAIPIPMMPRCRTDFETFRNELNCNEFFVCVNRKPIKFQCPADLAYSPQFGVCDYPGLVDCSSASNFIQPAPPSIPAQPTPNPSEPAFTPPGPIFNPPQPPASPAQTPSETSMPVHPSQRPTFFPPGSKPAIINLPNLPDKLPSLSDILDGGFNRFPGGVPKPQEAEDGDANRFQFNPKVSDGQAIFMQNSIYNSHQISTPVAVMSPQEAVRFLKLNSIVELQSSQPAQPNDDMM